MRRRDLEMPQPELSADYTQALRALSMTLEADGYTLAVVARDPATVDVAVEAGPDACADCLVPKDVFVAMAKGMLPDTVTTITVSYPEGSAAH
jgi:hypothetical protein